MNPEIETRLTAVREQTHRLLAPLTDDQLVRQVDPIMSPPVWDMGHIAAYEELWLLTCLAGCDPLHPDRADLYDATETPRPERGDADLLGPEECRRYLGDVRERAIEVLGGTDLSPDGDPLTAGGFVFEMVAQHEAQHTETILQGLKMLPAGGYLPPRREAPAVRRPAARRALEFPGGHVALGAGEGGFAHDCERPRHRTTLGPFRLAATPVTNGEHLAFLEDGGYRRPELWTGEGWRWREESGAGAPLYWEPDGEGGWIERDFERVDALDPHRVLCHVSAHEADAHARWAGARLPTEAEWEHAASVAARDGANLGQRSFRAGAAGEGDDESVGGCRQMLGDVWEWTSSPFDPYPGFRAFPYAEYAEVFFGGPYRALRGGSWATQNPVARTTFRNWDLPERRQIFAGMRLAWSA